MERLHTPYAIDINDHEVGRPAGRYPDVDVRMLVKPVLDDCLVDGRILDPMIRDRMFAGPLALCSIPAGAYPIVAAVQKDDRQAAFRIPQCKPF